MSTFRDLSEKITKKKVIRDGKKLIKKTDDREGYKMVDGKSVKMTAQERLKRSKAAKKSAIKRKSTTKQSNLKRKKSMKRRTF